MFEDLSHNLVAPHALGMTTVLVVPPDARVIPRGGRELQGHRAPHVDHLTDDLVGFLEAIACDR
jgi:putative hydrolase of the HAD superfamily